MGAGRWERRSPRPARLVSHSSERARRGCVIEVRAQPLHARQHLAQVLREIVKAGMPALVAPGRSLQVMLERFSASPRLPDLNLRRSAHSRAGRTISVSSVSLGLLGALAVCARDIPSPLPRIRGTRTGSPSRRRECRQGWCPSSARSRSPARAHRAQSPQASPIPIQAARRSPRGSYVGSWEVYQRSRCRRYGSR